MLYTNTQISVNMKLIKSRQILVPLRGETRLGRLNLGQIEILRV